jgi:hypothetical protein
MSRTALAAAGLVVLLSAGAARAQPQFGGQQMSPYGRPVISPYLNLFRPGNLGINYFGLVRPQIEAREAFEQLRITSQLPPTGSDPQSPIPITGHRTTFGNYQAYFGNVQPVLVPGAVMRPMTVGQPVQGFGRGPAPRR